MMMMQQSNNFGMNFNQQRQMYKVIFPQNVQPPPPSLSTYMSPQISPLYRFSRSVPPSVYPTKNVTSTPIPPGPRDDLNLS